MFKLFPVLAAALALSASAAFTPPANTNSYTESGVTYAQKGGIASSNYVVTAVDVSAKQDALPYPTNAIPYSVIANAPAETDPTVPAWAKSETPPQTMTTNDVRSIVTNATNGAVAAAKSYTDAATNAVVDEATVAERFLELSVLSAVTNVTWTLWDGTVLHFAWHDDTTENYEFFAWYGTNEHDTTWHDFGTPVEYVLSIGNYWGSYEVELGGYYCEGGHAGEYVYRDVVIDGVADMVAIPDFSKVDVVGTGFDVSRFGLRWDSAGGVSIDLGPVVRHTRIDRDVESATLNRMMAGKQDALPYPTNAIPYGVLANVPKVNGQPLTNDITIASGVTSVNGETGVVELVASDVGAYSQSAGETLQDQVLRRALSDSVALAYDPDYAYLDGDYAISTGQLYECMSPVTNVAPAVGDGAPWQWKTADAAFAAMACRCGDSRSALAPGGAEGSGSYRAFEVPAGFFPACADVVSVAVRSDEPSPSAYSSPVYLSAFSPDGAALYGVSRASALVNQAGFVDFRFAGFRVPSGSAVRFWFCTSPDGASASRVNVRLHTVPVDSASGYRMSNGSAWYTAIAPAAVGYVRRCAALTECTVTNVVTKSYVESLGVSSELRDSVRDCTWVPAVTNGVFYWYVKEE